MRKVVIIPLDKINVQNDHPVGGEPDYNKWDRKPYWETAILKVDDLNFAGFSVGFVPEGQQSRRVVQGPYMPGPHAFAYARAGVIDEHGGTKAELNKARIEGRLFEAKMGDLIDVGGILFEIQPDHNRNIKLVQVEKPTRNDLIQRAVATLLNGDTNGRLVHIACTMALSQRSNEDPVLVITDVLEGIFQASTNLHQAIQAIGVNNHNTEGPSQGVAGSSSY